MLTKSATISKSVRVGKFIGIGFLNVETSRGDVKMFHGDHLVEVDYTRAARTTAEGLNPKLPADKQPTVTRTHRFVVTEDCAKAMGIFLKETVEQEQERLAKEAAEKAAAGEEKK